MVDRESERARRELPSRLGYTPKRCMCGYECRTEDQLVDHISYMVSIVGESNSKHEEA